MKGREYDDLDRTIVLRVLSGDGEAFREIVDRYQRRIYGFGLRFFRNPAEAEDFVQEVFLKVFRKLSEYRGDARFYSWLMSIAYHQAVDMQRSMRKAEPSLSEEVSSAKEERQRTAAEEDSNYSLTPEASVIRQEVFAALDAAVRGLPPAAAACIDLFYYQRLSYNEISKISGIPVNTVKSHVFRSRNRLRKALSGSAAEAYHEM
jgi:RNA polymerase sigma-70 factor (ECF subfamily)